LWREKLFRFVGKDIDYTENVGKAPPVADGGASFKSGKSSAAGKGRSKKLKDAGTAGAPGAPILQDDDA